MRNDYDHGFTGLHKETWGGRGGHLQHQVLTHLELESYNNRL